MWRNYFFQIQSKYNLRVSTTEPLVIRFDGKDVTKDSELNFFEIYPGSFTDALEKTVKFFTEKYQGYAIFGSDEVSFIFPDPLLVIADLDVDKCNRVNEITALYSQIFFHHFNQIYSKRTIFWHGKTFSIPKEKLKSYIKYRSGNIKNVLVTYFLKKKGIHLGNEHMQVRTDKAKEFNDYQLLENYQDGILYYNGDRINLSDFMEKDLHTVVKVDLPDEIDYIDLSSFI